jgi:hypothetical protein
MSVDKFTAADSVLGYVYQFRYALSVALDDMRDNPDHFVSIELVEDVAIESKDGFNVLVQAKHHDDQAPSLTDYSTDLWKTLRVWSTAVYSGELDLTRTTLVLATTSEIAADSAASYLQRQGRDPATAKVLLESAMGKSTNKELATAFAAFSSLNSNQRLALLAAMFVADNEPQIDAMRTQIEVQLRFAAPRERVPHLTERLEGWWFNQVILALSSSPRRSIPLFSIDLKLNELRESFGSENLPIDYRNLLPSDDEHQEFLAMTFVEQMRLVGANHQIVDAIKDYYRAFTQRNRWVSDSLLYIDDLEAYEDRLKEAWRQQFNWMLDELSEDAAEAEMQRRGRQLLKWVLDVPEHYIKPECTEPYVVRGNLHILAENLHVGWHPDFEKRLTKVLQEATT